MMVAMNAASFTTPAACRVLVADDEAMLRTMLSRVLRMHGFEVTLAVDGADALRLLAADHYDVVLSDVVMPVCDGRCLLREMRARGQSTPVVMLSGYAEGSSDTLRTLGAAAVLGKPAPVQEIVDALRAAVARAPRA